MTGPVPQEIPRLPVRVAPLPQVAALLGELGAIDIAIEQLLFRRAAVTAELRRLTDDPEAFAAVPD